MSAAMRSGSSSAMAWVPPAMISRAAPGILSAQIFADTEGGQRVGVADEHQGRHAQGR